MAKDSSIISFTGQREHLEAEPVSTTNSNIILARQIKYNL